MLRRRLGDVPGARVLVGKDRGKLATDALRKDASRRRADDATAAFAPLAGFDREKRFAGDVDVDDVELRCVSERAASSSGSGRGRARDDRDERRTRIEKTSPSRFSWTTARNTFVCAGT